MTRGSSFTPAFVAAGLLLIAGCQTQPGIRGYSSVEAIEPPPAPGENVQQAEIPDDYSPSYVKGELAKPVYPPDALAAHARKYVVYVTVTIDPSGRASNVVRSMRGIDQPNAFSEEFFQAVRNAVLTWEFSPAHNILWSRGPDGEMSYVGAEPVVSTMDFKFTFDVSGVVR